MLADGLTKIRGSNAALHKVLKTGVFSIRPEEEQLKLRHDARKSGQTNSDIRRSGIKENFGSCDSCMFCQTTIDPRHSMALSAQS